MRVLVIEDNIEVARQVKDTLERSLYIVDVVHDGEEGLFLGTTEIYDAVILDLGLPKLDGMSVLQQWRMALAEAKNMWQFFRVIDVERKQTAKAPHVVAVGLVPGEVRLLLLQSVEVHDDLYRAVVHRAQVHNGIGRVCCATAGALQM